MTVEPDYYTLLDLPTDAAPHEVRQRYRYLRQIYEDPLATYGFLEEEERAEQLRRIEEAYAVLGDPSARLAYDEELRRAGHPGPWYEPTGDLQTESAPAVPPPAPPPLAPDELVRGAYLRAVREHLGLSLEEVSRVIKITVTQLENIEAERFERLPAPVYLKGFLRSYARMIRLDADRVVADFMTLRERWEAQTG